MTSKHSLATPAAWKGVWTALITPLKTAGNGLDIDETSLTALIDAQIRAGIRGLVIAGSTGEGSLLGDALLEKVLRGAHAAAKGRIPLVAGLGIGGTESCLKNLRLAKSIGYAGVLASPPAYVKAPQRGLRDHFLRLAAEGLPLCLYEVASRASSSITLETLAELSASLDPAAKNIVALKDASGDLVRALSESEMWGSRLALLSGDDGSFSPFLASGGVGLVSVASHVLPRSFIFILEAALKNDFEAARHQQNRIRPLVDALFWESNPVPVKSLLAAQKKITSDVFCAPLVPLRTELLRNLLELTLEIEDHA